MPRVIGFSGVICWLMWGVGACDQAQPAAKPAQPATAEVEPDESAYETPGPPIDASELPADYRWQTAAAAANLTPGQIDQLSKDKLVIASKRTFQQVFNGYDHGGLPTFVTSDSLLAAYHALFEESVLRVERARVDQLRPLLKTLWDGHDVLFADPDSLPAKATHRAALTIGVARRLLGDAKFEVEDPGLAREIDAQVKLVISAKAAKAPAWMRSLDYSRFRPRGFYDRSDALRRYFRAVSWLQAVPFYVEDDASFAAILVLGQSLKRLEAAGPERLFGGPDDVAFFATFELFVGPGDDWDVRMAREMASNRNVFDPDDLRKERDQLLENPERPQVGAVGDESSPNFRVVSALRTPDAVLFQQTAEPAFQGRSCPSGLDVCAALGADEAAKLLAQLPNGEALLKVIDERPTYVETFIGDEENSRTLYEQYLACLRPLIVGVEPGVPELFQSEAWRRKSLQTACAGWAQLRHTWALQAKEGGGLFGGDIAIAGFVEPAPEFYSRMADLAERTAAHLDTLGALAPDFRLRADELRATADYIERKDFARGGAAAVKSAKADRDMPAPLDDILHSLADEAEEKDEARTAERVAATVPELRALADALERGERPKTPLAETLGDPDEPLGGRWNQFAQLARRLEALAHKQLRGLPASPAESEFLRNYGEQLAEVMGYDSVQAGRDDAPRVVSVFHKYDTGGKLLVATGRPTALFILYPLDGREVLCRGVVVPYHEFVYDQRLTDDEWLGMLGDDDGRASTAPPVPDWVRGLYNDDLEPKRKD